MNDPTARDDMMDDAMLTGRQSDLLTLERFANVTLAMS